jgi:two-component system OmpR family response regulator
VCRKLVEKHTVPIIISSARGDLSDKVTGLQMGADDYLPKPYDPKELYARILTVLRRTRKEEAPRASGPIRKSAFRVNRDEHLIYLNETPLSLTKAEYDVLAYLIDKHGFAISRDEMIDNIDAIGIDSSYKSIDVLIGRIRAKLGDTPKEQKYIQSVRGIGYKAVG